MEIVGANFYHVDGVETTEIERQRALATVLSAELSIAHPRQSGYHVKAAGWTRTGIVRGGNMEYAMSDAFIHGETSVVNVAYAADSNPDIKVIGFHNPETDPENLGVYPCGNCRDVLQAYVDPSTIIAAGNKHAVLIARLESYLFDTFEKTEEKVDFDEQDQALQAIEHGIDTFLPDDMKNHLYGAVLVGHHTLWRGSHYSNGAYDAVTPGVSAVKALQNRPQEDDEIERVVFARFGTVDEHPHVLYRDRQAILELDEVLRKTSRRTAPLPVLLLTMDRESRRIIAQHKTDVAEWLPHPFTPGEFGMDDSVLQISSILSRRKS